MLDWPVYCSVDTVPAGARVLLYGAGGRGARALDLLRARRDDVTVLGFLDTYNSGELGSLPVFRAEDFVPGDVAFDLILVTTFDFVDVLVRLDEPFGGRLAVLDVPMPERKYAIVSHEHRAVFRLVPKVASTSVERALRESSEGPLVKLRETSLDDVPRDYFSFTFVRNPLDRLVSIFMHRTNNYHLKHYNKAMAFLGRDPSDFAVFVAFSCAIPDSIADIHLRSQHGFLADPTGRLDIDFIGRFERLGDDFGRVAERLGLSATLPHLLKSKRRSFAEYYTPELQERVAERYAADFEAFGYTASP